MLNVDRGYNPKSINISRTKITFTSSRLCFHIVSYRISQYKIYPMWCTFYNLELCIDYKL